LTRTGCFRFFEHFFFFEVFFEHFFFLEVQTVAERTQAWPALSPDRAA
jgi:hypothetical protein